MKSIAARVKRVIFAFIPTLFILSLLSGALSVMERYGLINTLRKDDAVAYAPIKLLRPVRCAGKRCLRIVDPQINRVDFLEKKPTDRFRIFILGESFAAGTPYNVVPTADFAEGTPAGWLDVLIRYCFPHADAEVISAAAGASTSKRVRAIANALLDKASPSLLIVAAGNNEGFSPSFLNEELHHWVVYRSLKKTLLVEPRPSSRKSNMTSADVAMSSLENFEANLKSIIQNANRHSVSVVLCTLPVNLKYDIRPSSHTLGGVPSFFMSSDSFLESGKMHQANGEYAEALEDYAKSSNRGIVLFYIGECLEAMERYDEAREAYRQYIQLAPICRAGWRINERIREIGNSTGVNLCDIEHAIESVANHGIPDFLLFHDSCHMQWFGYYHVAVAMFESIKRANLFPSTWGQHSPVPSLDEALRFAGWTSLPERGRLYNSTYRQFAGPNVDVDRDPRVGVPLAFETPSPSLK